MTKNEKRPRGRPRISERACIDVPIEISNLINSLARKQNITSEKLISALVRKANIELGPDNPEKKFLRYLVPFLNLNRLRSRVVENELIIKHMIPVFYHVHGYGRRNFEYPIDQFESSEILFFKLFLYTNMRDIVLATRDMIEKIVATSLPEENLKLEIGQAPSALSNQDTDIVSRWFTTPVKYSYNWEYWKCYRYPQKDSIEADFENPVDQEPRPEFWRGMEAAQTATADLNRTDVLKEATVALRIFRVGLIDWIIRTLGAIIVGYSPYSNHIRVCCVCGKWIYRETARTLYCSNACKSKRFRINNPG